MINLASENKYKYGLIILLVIAIAVSAFVVITKTNIIFKQSGEIWKTTLNINDIVGVDTGAGFVILTRNDKTPSILELTQFNNDKQRIYFSISEGQKIEKVISIKVPNAMEKGDYYFNTIVYLNNREYLTEHKFVVR